MPCCQAAAHCREEWSYGRVLAGGGGLRRQRRSRSRARGSRVTQTQLSSAASNAQPLLSVDDLHVHFPVRRGPLLKRKTVTLRAVDGVSFEVRAGETFSIVGESGCGKTTTSRAILKVEKPTSGRIVWEGKDLADIDEGETKAYRSAVQAVFQDPYSSMNPRLRIGSFIAEPLLLNSGIG